jgi:Skp family chaperone for outer membrane proteins
MNSVVSTVLLAGLAAGTLAYAQAPAAGAAPTKIAVINMSDAMAKTKEGQKAGSELNSKFGPKKAEYDKQEAAIQALTDQLNKGRATMSPDAQAKMTADIQSKSTSLKRFGEDAQSDMDAEEQKISQDLQSKLYPILNNYAIQNNYAIVLDIGNQPSPVLFAATATNITDVIVALYDQAHPVADSGAGAKPAATPTAPPAKPPVKK